MNAIKTTTSTGQEIKIIDQLRHMEVGEKLEYPAKLCPYLRNLKSIRLIEERSKGMNWVVNFMRKQGKTLVTRTS